MNEKEKKEFIDKVRFFNDNNRNLELMVLTSLYNTKSEPEFDAERKMMLEQFSTVVKMINIDEVERAFKLFHCPSPITNASLYNYYLSVNNLLSTKTEKEVDEFIKSHFKE